MANPFTLVPGNDYSQGLTGLQRSLENVAEMRAKDKAEKRYTKMKAEAETVFKTRDPEKIADFMIANPEMAKAMEVAYQFYDKDTKKNYLEGAYKILTKHEEAKREPEPDLDIPDGTVLPELEPPELGLRSELSPRLKHALGPGPNATVSKFKEVLDERKAMLTEKGVPPERTRETDSFLKRYAENPEKAIRKIEFDVASMDPKGYKAWKEVYRPTSGKDAPTTLSKWMNERDALIESGLPLNHPDVVDLQDRISGKSGKDAKRISPHLRLINERDAYAKKLLDSGMSPEDIEKDRDYRSFQRKILADDKEWAPTTLKKQLLEREDLKDKLRAQGLTEDQILENKDIVAYDDLIAGYDTTIRGMWTQDKIDVWGAMTNLNNGKIPSVGRGKNAGLLRQLIAMSAAKQALGNPQFGGGGDISPSQAAINVVATSHDTKAIGSAITQLNKQIASMDSFVQNMDQQIDHIQTFVDDLHLFDTRLLNVPWRFVRQKIMGDPTLSSYDIFLKELARENTKLAQGATQSIAAMNQHEVEVWDRIHDANLSFNDMMKVLRQTRQAAAIRMQSVQDALERARTRSRTRDFGGTEAPKEISTQEQYDAYRKEKGSGAVYINTVTGKRERTH